MDADAKGDLQAARLERFFRDGRLEQMPRRWEDKQAVVRLLATKVLVLDEPTTERALTDRLAELAHDPVGMRRAMVDAGLVTRTRDGTEYWRTRLTEFDAGGDREARGETQER